MTEQSDHKARGLKDHLCSVQLRRQVAGSLAVDSDTEGHGSLLLTLALVPEAARLPLPWATVHRTSQEQSWRSAEPRSTCSAHTLDQGGARSLFSVQPAQTTKVCL